MNLLTIKKTGPQKNGSKLLKLSIHLYDGDEENEITKLLWKNHTQATVLLQEINFTPHLVSKISSEVGGRGEIYWLLGRYARYIKEDDVCSGPSLQGMSI